MSSTVTGEDVIHIDDNAVDQPAEIAKGETAEQHDGSVRYRLHYPRTVSRNINNLKTEEALEEITVKRPTGGDIRQINKVKDQLEASVMAFSLLTGLPNVVFDKLDAKDIRKISEVVNGFMGESQ